jgi:hypothetical protein
MEFKSQIFKAPSLTKTPKLKKTTFASSTFSSISKSTSIPKVNYGGFVKLLKSKSSGIDLEKISTPTNDNITSTLIETNRILVEIQKQLSYDFAMRIAEEKEKRQIFQKEKSRKKLKAEESQLEKVGKKIGGAVAKTAGKILAPVKNIFDKIIDFVITLGAGIAVNAVFEWLKDPKNIEKVKGWFSWIKDNWKWMAVAVGAIALLPVISTISGLIGPVGIIVGLLAKAVPLLIGFLLNPLTLKAMLAIGAGILIYKGGEFLLKKARNLITGGEDFSEAHNVLDEKLRNAGLNMQGKTKSTRGMAPLITPEQQKIAAEVIAKRGQLKDLKKKMEDEIQAKKLKIEEDAGITMSSSNRQLESVTPIKQKAEQDIREDYKLKISNIITPTTIEPRKMGGPVKAGRPYLVGESGPELIVPNIDGTVINNMKTEKIYQMISSDTRRKISYIELPPITQQIPPPEIPIPASESTVVPFISSVNKADYFIEESPKLYGIMV